MYAIPSLTNCVFSENHTSTYYGGGMHNYYSSPMLTNCIFYANTVGVEGIEIDCFHEESSAVVEQGS